MKKPIVSLAVIAASALVMLTLFPPWTTIMGGYPKIPYHWVFSTPKPIESSGDGKEHFEFRVDILRLQRRYASVLAVFIAGCAIAYFASKIRDGKGT